MIDQWKKLVGGIREPKWNTDPLPLANRVAAIRWQDLPESWHFPWLPALQFQKHAGACVAHAWAICGETLTYFTQGALVEMSRMDLYWGARFLRGWQNEDTGCLPGDMVRWTASRGTCSEDMWPYDPSRVTDMNPPSDAAAEREMHRFDGRRIDGSRNIAAALCGEDGLPARPVMFTIPVYDSLFDSTAKDGWVRPPMGGIRGYHEVVFVGYDRELAVPGFGPGAFLAQNSWDRWGVAHPTLGATHSVGHFWVPVELVDDSDFVLDAHAPDEPLPVEAV